MARRRKSRTEGREMETVMDYMTTDIPNPEETKVTPSSGDVFADLDVKRPDIAGIKADVEKAYRLSRDPAVNKVLSRCLEKFG